MRALSLIAVAVTAHAAAFANSNAGSKFFISTTPAPANLTAETFGALTFTEVKGVGSVGETGVNTNILTYDTWDTEVAQKAKGISDAGSPVIEVARDPTDAGQIAMRTAAAGNLNYAFKIEKNDKPSTNANATGTIIYNRGLVAGPLRPNGRNEDFDLLRFTLALQQKEIEVAPTAGTP